MSYLEPRGGGHKEKKKNIKSFKNEERNQDREQINSFNGLLSTRKGVPRRP